MPSRASRLVSSAVQDPVDQDRWHGQSLVDDMNAPAVVCVPTEVVLGQNLRQYDSRSESVSTASRPELPSKSVNHALLAMDQWRLTLPCQAAMPPTHPSV